MSTIQRRVLLAGILVVGAALILRFTLFRPPAVQTSLVAAGTVEATDARVGFQTPGRIDTITVREGDPVGRGDTLAVLARDELLARRLQAEAQVTAARALLLELERGSRSEEVAQARAARDAAQERLTDAARDADRATRLFEGGAISREAHDKAAVAREVAARQLTQAEEQVKLVEAGPRPERIAAQRAQLAQARASLEAVQAQLANTVLAAPFAGIVTVRHYEPGETVGAGAPVLTIMNPDDRWVRIYVREDRIGAVKLGTSATVTTDTFRDKEYRGEVMFIASEAEFTPKNVQTTEERVKLVYAVKVRITGDPAYDLKPGIPADVRLDLEST